MEKIKRSTQSAADPVTMILFSVYINIYINVYIDNPCALNLQISQKSLW